MYEDYDDKRLTSVYNLTVNQNIEIRNILNDCNRFARSGKLIDWKFSIDALKRELKFDIRKLDEKKDDALKFSTKIDAIRLQLSKLKLPIQKTEAYELLEKYEELVREVQELSGKGTKRIYDDDDDDD